MDDDDDDTADAAVPLYQRLNLKYLLLTIIVYTITCVCLLTENRNKRTRNSVTNKMGTSSCCVTLHVVDYDEVTPTS